MSQSNNNKGLLRLLATFGAEYFTIFVLLLFSVASFVFYNNYFKSYYEEVTEKNAFDNSQKETKLNDLSLSIASLERYKTLYDNISDYQKQRLNDIIPDDKNMENLMPWMYSIIEGDGESGITLESIDISGGRGVAKVANSPKITDPIGEIVINMTIKGLTYGGLKNFLAILEKNLRLMDIQMVNISEESVTMSLKTYYFNSPTNIPTSAKNKTLERQEIDLSIFDSKKFQGLEKVEFFLDEYDAIPRGNEYPFGMSESEQLMMEQLKRQELNDAENITENGDNIMKIENNQE